MRYLGIDYGTKKVGLAVSDEAGTMGFPHGVFPTTPRLIDDVLALIAQKDVGAVVIGESLDFKGKENPVAYEARAFGTQLERRIGIPVMYQPEVLTTQEARRNFEGVREPGSGNVAVDAQAAALILTSYLDTHAHERRTD